MEKNGAKRDGKNGEKKMKKDGVRGDAYVHDEVGAVLHCHRLIS